MQSFYILSLADIMLQQQNQAVIPGIVWSTSLVYLPSVLSKSLPTFSRLQSL
jgi:hypothetical protein